jgi:hypothetical protein
VHIFDRAVRGLFRGGAQVAHAATLRAREVPSLLFFPASELERPFGEPFDVLAPKLIKATRWLDKEPLLSTAPMYDGSPDSESSDISWGGGGFPEPGLLTSPSSFDRELFWWGCGRPSGELDVAAVEFDPPVPACYAMKVSTWDKRPCDDTFERRIADRERASSTS